MENNIVSEKIKWMKSKMDELPDINSKDELTDAYTELIGELSICYGNLIENIVKTALEGEIRASEEQDVKYIDESIETSTEASEETLADVTATLEESETDDETIEEDATTEKPESEPTPYAVFYSKNNAAYVAIDKRARRCITVRNLAKAYCVAGDLTSVVQGQNELSKYNIDKLKPIEIKFLTQKEYDDTIGKAKEMQKLIASMPKSVDTGNASTIHKVTNFASDVKSDTSKSHIGEKKDNVNENSGSGYNFFKAKPYNGVYDTTSYNKTSYGLASHNKTSHNKTSSTFKVTMRDALENPRELYKLLHNNIDDGSSYENDLAYVRQAYDINDFDTITDLIRETIRNIENTNSKWIVAWLIEDDEPIVDEEFLMDVDYSLFDKAIDAWTDYYDDTTLIYVEDFDPTILNFKQKIQEVSDKYGIDESDMTAMAIYNYVRCLAAYARYMKKVVWHT